MIVFDSNHWVNVKHIETTDLGQHTGKRKYDSANFLGIFNVLCTVKKGIVVSGKTVIHLWKKNISAENIFFLEGLKEHIDHNNLQAPVLYDINFPLNY